MDKIALKTLRNTVLAVIYIFGVSQLLQNGEKLFGKMDNMFSSFVFLMLFSLSAAVVGGLIFGQAIFLFFDGKKKESVKAAVYSVGWLALFTVIGVVALMLI